MILLFDVPNINLQEDGSPSQCAVVNMAKKLKHVNSHHQYSLAVIVLCHMMVISFCQGEKYDVIRNFVFLWIKFVLL